MKSIKISSEQIENNIMIKNYPIRILTWVFILLFSNYCYANDHPTWLNLENLSEKNIPFSMDNPEDFVLDANSSMVLDSIYEIKNLDLKLEKRRTYFNYDPEGSLSSYQRFYYNHYDEFTNHSEIKKFNKQGLPIKSWKMQLAQQDFELEWYGDTIETDIKEYRYENGLLIEYLEKPYEDSQSFMQGYKIYKYDSIGRLTCQIQNMPGFPGEITEEYTYKTNGDTSIVIFKSSWEQRVNYYVENTITTTSDTLRKTTIYYSGYYEILPPLESITNWELDEEIFEHYDEQGRLKFCKALQNHSEFINSFKVEYQYAQHEEPIHATYYTLVNSATQETWKETCQIECEYDKYGNLLVYNKTFYDAKIDARELDHHKTYYYSEKTTPISKIATKRDQLILFPNPAKDILHVPEISGKAAYRIYSLNGEQVQSGNLLSNTIYVNELLQGLYVIHIFEEGQTLKAKFIKQ